MLKYFALLLLLSAGALVAQPQSALVDRLDRARQASTIDEESLRPWHLVVSFDLLTLQGSVSEHGTFDELWSSPTVRRRAFVSPGYTATETLNQGKTFRTKGLPSPPELLAFLEDQLEHPIPDKADVDGATLRLQKETIAKIALECLTLNPQKALGFPPLGLNPTFCFDPGEATLRSFFNYGSQQVFRNSIGQFQGKSVPLDLFIFEGGHKVLRAHIDQLTTFSPQDSSFVQMPTQDPVSPPILIGTEVAARRLLTKPTPEYPFEARQAHIFGPVVLQATISKEGRVTSLIPKSSPSMILTDSALRAVRQWTYQPFLVQGEPVGVQTTITVNYNMGR